MATNQPDGQDSTTPNQIRYEIENVNGIGHADLTLRPGMTVLTGPNGAGKGQTISAVARATGADVPVSVSDGADQGSIKGFLNGAPFVHLKVGKVVRTEAGESSAHVEISDSGPFGRFVHPGFADPDACARERVRALLRLTQTKLTDSNVEVLVEDCPGYRDWLLGTVRGQFIEDLVEASQKLAKRIHQDATAEAKKAQKAKGAEEEAAGRVRAIIRDHFGNKPLAIPEATHDETLAEFQRSAQDLAAMTASCDARKEAERRAANLKADRQPRPDVDASERAVVEALQEQEAAEVAFSLAADQKSAAQWEGNQALEADDRRRTLRSNLEQLESQIQELQGRIQSAKDDLEKLGDTSAALDEARQLTQIRTEEHHAAGERARNARVTHAAAVTAHAKAMQAAESWDKVDAILAMPINGTTPEELDRATSEHEKLRLLLEKTRHADAYRSESERVTIHGDERSRAETKHKNLRELAWGLPLKLGKLIEQAGVSNVFVKVVKPSPRSDKKAMRVFSIIKGKERDWEDRMSPGQRMQVAVPIAAQFYDEGSVVCIPAEMWLSLDGPGKLQAHKLLADHNLVGLSEEPSKDTEVGAEHLGTPGHLEPWMDGLVE